MIDIFKKTDEFTLIDVQNCSNLEFLRVMTSIGGRVNTTESIGIVKYTQMHFQYMQIEPYDTGDESFMQSALTNIDGLKDKIDDKMDDFIDTTTPELEARNIARFDYEVS